METILFGTLALTLAIISVCCLYYKKAIFSLICSIGSIPVTYFVGYCWREMLIASGKNTALLGFNRYPLVVIILAVLLIVAFVVSIVSIIKIIKRIIK